MKTKQCKWMMLLAIILTAITFTACGGDDDKGSAGNGSGSGVTGYYIEGGLYTYTDYKNRLEHLADIFDSDFYEMTHPFFDSDGHCIWASYNERTFIRVDDNCIYSYSGVTLYQLGASGTKGMELLYKFDAGEFGTVGFYGFPDVIYVYTRDGNRLIVDVGDGKNTNTFLITDGGLILSGGSNYTKYNPYTTY